MEIDDKHKKEKEDAERKARNAEPQNAAGIQSGGVADESNEDDKDVPEVFRKKYLKNLDSIL